MANYSFDQIKAVALVETATGQSSHRNETQHTLEAIKENITLEYSAI